jgi:hypothetical protein
MSIPVLTQAYDEVRRLAIAGSAVAPGDYRLRKLVPPLEQAGRKAPVFLKVAEAVERLVGSDERTSAAALLELATLLGSILHTQGETGAEGDWTPLPSRSLGRPRTKASARVLKPLQEALTGTGSGRLEVIRDGFERGAFADLRLVAPALAALDDGYGEIADFVAEAILPPYGPGILPELLAGFDPRGRGGQVRRLLLMHRLDPEAARPHVLRSLDEGSPEVRVAAIGCLGESPDDLRFLLEQARARAKDVRAAALKSLARSGADEAARVLCDALRRDDLTTAVEPLRAARHPAVTAAVLDEAEALSRALVAGKAKDVKELGTQNERMMQLLRCLEGRDDARTEALLLAMFEALPRLWPIKGTPGGKDVVERLVSVMAAGPPRARSALIDAHETLPAEGLGEAFLAARRSRDPAEVFALFGPYLAVRVDEKKKRAPAWAKREAIISHLTPGWHRVAFGEDGTPALPELDPRWLDLAVEIGRAELVRDLAAPGHAGARAFLAEQFRKKLDHSGDEYELSEILEAMIRVGHPGATDGLVDWLRKLARSKATYAHYAATYWVGRLIPSLPPAEALPKLEALLPTLPEKMVDALLARVAELKQATSTEAAT